MPPGRRQSASDRESSVATPLLFPGVLPLTSLPMFIFLEDAEEPSFKAFNYLEIQLEEKQPDLVA